MSDARTIALYDERAADYDDAFGPPKIRPALRAFMDAMPAGGRVLDLGCGPGRSAHLMAREGFDVDPVDGSAGMVERAQKHYGLPARQMRFDELTSTQSYDGVWANFSLTHAPHAALPGHLAAIARALRPGGPFHIALKTGTGEMRDALGRFYALHTPADIAQMLTAAGFAIQTQREGAEKGLAGTDDPYITILAERLHD